MRHTSRTGERLEQLFLLLLLHLFLRKLSILPQGLDSSGLSANSPNNLSHAERCQNAAACFCARLMYIAPAPAPMLPKWSRHQAAGVSALFTMASAAGMWHSSLVRGDARVIHASIDLKNTVTSLNAMGLCQSVKHRAAD